VTDVKEYTIVATTTGFDPWFVRARSYPGIGSALAWDAPVVATRDTPVVRRFDIYVVDGRLNDGEIAAHTSI
jgi:hypothetical protein